jgi:hypothetical protein
MNNILYLKDYISRKSEDRPRQITFYSPAYLNNKDELDTFRVNVNVENGDVASVLSAVQEFGGAGTIGEDGVFRFVPWPCVFEVRDL